MINKKNLRDIILAGISKEIVLFEDSTDLENIETEYVNEYRFNSEEAREFIDRNFSERQRLDSSIQDRSVLGITSFDFYGGRVFINFEKGSYRTHLATLEPGYREYIENRNFFVVPLFLMNIVLTRDDKIVVSRAPDGQLDLIGDFLGEKDVVDEKINFFSASFSHISGKTGNLYLCNAKLLGIFIKSTCCFLVLRYDTNSSARELEKALVQGKSAGEGESEGRGLHFLRNREEELGEAIENPSFTREARTALKFYMKNIFCNYKYINTKI
ncbi:MAG: hypothetical protein LBU15_02445 [Rickettsiales bacterium]|jgi:hypothetical protein|nr:hypothetical protein [Rickettsiales bacterium]